MAKEEKEQAKNHSKHKSVLWLLGVSFLAVALLLFCQFYFGDGMSETTTFYQNTYINGVDVSGMTKQEAENVVSDKLLKSRDHVELTLKANQKQWKLSGSDFEITNAIEKPLTEVLSYGRDGNVFQKKKFANKIKQEGLNVTIPYNKVLGGMNEKIETIIQEVEKEASLPLVEFHPDAPEMFKVSKTLSGIQVDRDLLQQRIDQALETSTKADVEIPLREIIPDIDKELLIQNIQLRSSFTTSYATSKADRKSNVKKALASFNGMIVEPGETVSFNKTTGPRTVENGYKKANIIVNGVYVSGAGGGVCQASTTLYNALLLADVDVLQANHHSLPASYVPLSFDAMVSEGYSDLVFKNTLESPIYIKAYGDETDIHVEIYGQPFEPGKTIRTRAEFIKVLPHNGDKIIADKKGEYASYVLYKGEYHRLKYPREGYESKGYIQYLQDGVVVSEKMIRHDYYWPQDGIIVEGVEQLGEGMNVPANDVKMIPAQKVTQTTTDSVRHKLEKTNPSAYNP